MFWNRKVLLPFLTLMALCMTLCDFALPGVCAAWTSPRVLLTFNNKTSQQVQVAIVYSGFDMCDDSKVGWYFLAPGETRTITLPKKISPSMTMDGTGYYAKSRPRTGQKTLQWSGKFMKLSVRDKKFKDPQDKKFANGWMAGFRKIKLSRPNQESDAKASITFKE